MIQITPIPRSTHGLSKDGNRRLDFLHTQSRIDFPKVSRPIVTWFSNRHEHSVQWCKLGFMRLARQGEIVLEQIPNELAQGLLPEPLIAHTHRRKAIIRIRDGKRDVTALLDGEDSIFQTSELILHCDLNFVCAYRGSFFQLEPFDMGYSWQTEKEIDYYRSIWKEKQAELGKHFYKCRPFMPIGPDLTVKEKAQSFLKQKTANLKHRVLSALSHKRDWHIQHEAFEKRYAELLELRSSPIRYDVVLKDSLWGWPRHRNSLHNKLARLGSKWNIHSQLSYRDCFDYEYAGFEKPNPEDYPMVVGNPNQDNYEAMLAASRLAIFATGFHWGCRNIQTLAWFLGVRVLSDRLLFECSISLDTLQNDWNDSDEWSDIESCLVKASNNTEIEEKQKRSKEFDSLLSPEIVANRVLNDCLS